ncbi:MFS transporter [Miltoncostaea marina]|uniref:MFS transporter n=1 Tax=Miltoncostaea marina TaxID=2843215 RepID=UPI001C3D5C02|nr:MFS transporter [Miltoncostaea marina]
MGRRAGRGPSFLLSPLGIVFTTVVIDLIGFGIVLPILPLWAEEFGASPVEIGVITASYAVMQLIFAPVWGRLSDRHGRRPVILISLAGSALAALAIGLAGTLLVIFLARVLQGVAGASYAAAQAYVADVTSRAERAKGMGMIGAAFGIGFVLGPAIGALFSSIDDRLPFFVAAGLAAANLLIAYRRLPESRRPGATEAPAPRLALVRRALSARELAPLVWISFVATFAFVGMESTFALFGERRFDYDMTQMALLFTYIGVVTAVAQGWAVARVVARWGERRVMIGGLLGTAAGLLGVAAAEDLWLLLPALGVLSLAAGLVFSTTTALISLAASEREQGLVLGVSASVGGAARIAGPLAATALFQHAGIAVPLVMGAALFALCAAGAVRAAPRPALSASQ